jgi:outer membrane biosynthesis protein TonB
VTAPEKKPEPVQPSQPPVVAVPESKPEPAKPVVPPPATVPEKKPEPVKPAEPAAPVPAPESGATPTFKGGTPTGVVVDGRGLGLRPALLPKIIDPQGQEIYVGQVVTRTNAVEQGVAGYAKDVNAAASNFRVTDNPAVIKGVRAAGSTKTDVMVSQADAQMLRQLSSKGDFLQNCRVIIVY